MNNEEQMNLWLSFSRGDITYEQYVQGRPDFPSRAKEAMDDRIIYELMRKEYARLTGGASSEPVVETLEDALKRDREPVTYRIDHMLVVGHNTNIAASYKTGKTTLLGNRARALADGVPFLDAFDVKPVDGKIVIFNYEVSDNQFLTWLDRLDIKNKHLIVPVNLRGKGVYIQDDIWCEWAIKTLRELECEVWEIDPLSAAIRGNTKDEEVASEWIARAERIKAEAGVSDLILTTHTGHLAGFDADGRAANERTAGAARWMGWPDSLWTYTKDKDENRYLSVLGRDVECEEFQVSMDPTSMRLSDKGRGTSRAKAKDLKAWAQTLIYIRDHPSCTATDLTDEVGRDGAKAKKRAIEMGLVEEVDLPHEGRGRPAKGLRLTPLGASQAIKLH